MGRETNFSFLQPLKIIGHSYLITKISKTSFRKDNLVQSASRSPGIKNVKKNLEAVDLPWTGLPDFSLLNVPKQGNMYIPNCH
jgi:hypothetical protein